MGCDWATLFDMRMCNEILSLTRTGLPSFLQAHLPKLSESLFCAPHFENLLADVRVSHLHAQGESELNLKDELIQHLCFSDRWIYLDYYACYVEVFPHTEGVGAIHEKELLPHRDESSFLLLLPSHVDQMIDSWEKHRAEARVMSDDDLAELRSWRNRSANDEALRVAYCFDV